jgi:zinc transport system permease protein
MITATTIIVMTATAMDSFIVRAIIAGIGVALVTGPLGCFIIWRRMAYFGDTLSHAALTGVAIGILLGINTTIGIVATGLVVGALLLALQRQRLVPVDTVLGILSHGALALGLIVIGLMSTVRIDLMGYLFGDILAVAPADLAWIYGGGAVVLAGLMLIWQPLTALTVHEDIAAAEGIRTSLIRMTFTALIALTVAIAMKIVGVLLVTALLIVPAATARRFATTPESMAVGAALVGVVAVIAGLSASLIWDTPSGPSIVAAAVVAFALVTTASGFAGALKRP